ncbi:MAG: sodium:solute symporter family protein [Eubacterium sp.]|nr:sodium:solute symporter family protein [Eubacterium sp.]
MVYIIIGLVVSRHIKSIDDYYVAGRRAPAVLIAGSLVASYTSTGMFMGEAGTYYAGGFNGLLICGLMASTGYVFGSVFFGRYLRRSGVMTIPEFFGKRFCSVPVKNLAAITAVVMMLVYLISVMQGIGTMMNAVTDIDYNVCITIAMVVFTFITVIAGSSGVLITDTLMASFFTVALFLAAMWISSKTGGWFGSVDQIAESAQFHDLLSAKGVVGVLASTSLQSVAWGVINGVVWMGVAMVGPWQSSRYLMAKDERTVVSSAVPAAFGIFMIEFVVAMIAIFVNLVNPDIEDPSRVLIWAAMNMMPKVLGVILLTGVLAAGISSATTFLSLIGATFSNDIVGDKGKNPIRVGQIAMVVTSVAVLCFCIINPPALFWIMLFGGAVVAAAWMPTVLASILSKRLTSQGAFAGMLCGFVSCFAIRLYTAVTGAVLPVWFDHAFVGMIFNVLAMVVVSAFTQVTPEQREAREKLFVMPEAEKAPENKKGTMRAAKYAAVLGVIEFVVLLVLWVAPFIG